MLIQVSPSLVLITFFTVLDANLGFYKIPFSPKAKIFTTFLSAFGRFAFNCLHFELSSSTEFYCKIVSHVLEGLDGVIRHIDDVCIWGKYQEEQDNRVGAVLRKMVDAGMTLNVEKFKRSLSSINFFGHVITSGAFMLIQEQSRL